MLTPGAEMLGRMSPPAPGPRLEKDPTVFVTSYAPTPYASAESAGLPAVSQPGPSLPLEKTAKIPAAFHACNASSNHGSSTGPLSPPQELFRICGRRSGRGLAPDRSVGASIHCAAASSAESLHPRSWSSQPFAVIQRAPGATPTELPASSEPTMVPIVWVP